MKRTYYVCSETTYVRQFELGSIILVGVRQGGDLYRTWADSLFGSDCPDVKDGNGILGYDDGEKQVELAVQDAVTNPRHLRVLKKYLPVIE